MVKQWSDISQAACSLAAQVPLATMQLVAQTVQGAPDLESARDQVGQLPHPHYRDLATEFLEKCLAVEPPLSTGVVAMALLTAARSAAVHRAAQGVELAWTGPDLDVVPFRRTEQVILQVLDSAVRRITLVSYAVYRIQRIREALVRAAKRGVRINVVVETPDRLEGQNEYSTIEALGDDVAACSRVYFWPQERRPREDGNRCGILHVKCVVADGRWLFLSSANLTEYAFRSNMELGVLVTGGPLPSQVESHFDQLISAGVLERV